MQELHVKSLLPVRLDKYLMEQFPALGLGRLNKALRENKIKLNGKKQPLATRVQNGDVIRVYLLDDQLGLTSQEGPEFLQARAPAEFIYENDDLIVANKPAGIPVDGDESDTLLNRVLRRLYEEKRWDAAHEPRLCHRLDTGTSGLVLLAKTAAAEEFLVNAIKERLIRKTYLCVTFGRPVPPAATLRSRSSSSNRARTSRKAPGSSNRMVVPPWASAMARYTRWRSPPESARTSRFAQSSVPVRRMACSTAAVSCAVIRREKPRYGNRPCATSARTVIPGTGRDCGINAAVRANSLRP